ncbi:MAG: GNAT family N-acetyltransferase [Gammaproteobacteria bacterium]|nr:GNAT family N-acetyltransferase [Gammaproteobacteria bacterium]
MNEARARAATRCTARLLLRPFQDADLDALYAIQGDTGHMRYTYSPSSREACREWLLRHEAQRAEQGLAPWSVLDRSSGRILGWGGLCIDPDLPDWGPEVIYFIDRSRGGRGFATELVGEALAHAFLDLDLPAVTAFAMRENLASQRVLLRSGFRPRGFEQSLDRLRFELSRACWHRLQADRGAGHP